MQTTSALYNTIIASQNHWFETRVRINGVYYGENQLFSVETKYRVFNSEQPTVGGCLAGELEVKMLMPSAAIPRMAEVRPYVRVTDGTQTSEWIPQGVFFIDTRETSHNDNGLDFLTLHCYDSILKAEADYPSTSHTWPVVDTVVVAEIATAMGVGVDTRTYDIITHAYSISLSAGYSMREVLSNIAAMYAGNWVMTYDGDLRLITLAELPAETNYLIDNTYDVITFGGDRILV